MLAPLSLFLPRPRVQSGTGILLLLYPLSGVVIEGWIPTLLGSFLLALVCTIPRLRSRELPESSSNALLWFCLGGVFLGLKWACFHFSATDENVYFYQAAAWAKGYLPYRDFFFAHPPLHLVPPALGFVFAPEFGLEIARSIAPLLTLSVGFLFVCIFPPGKGRFVALTNAVLFFFCSHAEGCLT